jgi:hypothetical protein
MECFDSLFDEINEEMDISIFDDITMMNMDENDQQQQPDQDTFILAKTSQEKAYYQSDQCTTKTWMIQTIKETNVLYICPEEQWKKKVQNYMEHIGLFSLIGSMTLETSDDQVQHVLNNKNTSTFD